MIGYQVTEKNEALEMGSQVTSVYGNRVVYGGTDQISDDSERTKEIKMELN